MLEELTYNIQCLEKNKLVIFHFHQVDLESSPIEMNGSAAVKTGPLPCAPLVFFFNSTPTSRGTLTLRSIAKAAGNMIVALYGSTKYLRPPLQAPDHAENSYHLRATAAHSSLSCLDRILKRLPSLWVIVYFPPYNPFPVD